MSSRVAIHLVVKIDQSVSQSAGVFVFSSDGGTTKARVLVLAVSELYLERGASWEACNVSSMMVFVL